MSSIGSQCKGAPSQMLKVSSIILALIWEWYYPCVAFLSIFPGALVLLLYVLGIFSEVLCVKASSHWPRKLPLALLSTSIGLCDAERKPLCIVRLAPRWACLEDAERLPESHPRKRTFAHITRSDHHHGRNIPKQLTIISFCNTE